jgi:uncharacterized membrane protein
MEMEASKSSAVGRQETSDRNNLDQKSFSGSTGHYRRQKTFFNLEKNISGGERLLSAGLGGTLVGYGMSQILCAHGWISNVAGLTLLARGVTGYSALYDLLDVDTTVEGQSHQKGMFDPHPIQIQRSITVWKPIEEVYQINRDMDKMKTIIPFVNNVKSLSEHDYTMEFARAKDLSLAVDVHITEQQENQSISWSATPAGKLTLKGTTTFRRAPKGNATEMTAQITLTPMFGAIGATFYRVMNPINEQILNYILGRFKQYAETGEVATIKGQPTGRKSAMRDYLPKRVSELADKLRSQTTQLVGERRIAS